MIIKIYIHKIFVIGVNAPLQRNVQKDKRELILLKKLFNAGCLYSLYLTLSCLEKKIALISVASLRYLILFTKGFLPETPVKCIVMI